MPRSSSAHFSGRIRETVAALLAVGSTSLAFAQGIEPPPLSFKPPAIFCANGPGSGPGMTGCDESALPLGLAIADITGSQAGESDDYPDVAVANSFRNTVSVLWNTGNWTDPLQELYGLELDVTPLDGLNGGIFPITAIDGQPYDVEFGDMDGDGDQDLVVSVQRIGEADCIVILWNNGLADFRGTQTPITLDSSEAYAIAVSDLDGDTDLDIAIAAATGAGAQRVARGEVLRRQTGGVFTTEIVTLPDAPSATRAEDVVAAYFRPVTDPPVRDLAFSIPTPWGEDSPQFGVASGAYGADPWIESTYDAVASSAIDFGKLRPGQPRDFVLTDVETNRMRIMKAAGSGYSLVPIAYNLIDTAGISASAPLDLDLGTLDHNTQNDVVIACQQGGPCSFGCVAVFQGTAPSEGNPTFHATPRFFATGPCGPPGNKTFPKFVEIANMDNSGFNDLVVSNQLGTVTVLINENVIP